MNQTREYTPGPVACSMEDQSGYLAMTELARRQRRDAEILAQVTERMARRQREITLRLDTQKSR